MSSGRQSGDGPDGGGDLPDGFLRELSEEGMCEGDAIEALIQGLEPAPVPGGLRARILASTETTPRFAFALEEVARLVDVTTQAARDLLLGIDRSESWANGPYPGIGLYNFEGGPEVRGAITGFIRMMPGEVFPHHRHDGEERVLVLSGRFRDSNGAVASPGDVMVNGANTEHSFEVLEGPELFYLVVADGGVTIDGEFFAPNDPRL